MRSRKLTSMQTGVADIISLRTEERRACEVRIGQFFDLRVMSNKCSEGGPGTQKKVAEGIRKRPGRARWLGISPWKPLLSVFIDPFGCFEYDAGQRF